MKRIARIFLLALALCSLSAIATAQQNKAEQMYQQALYEMEGKGDYAKAIGLFNRVAAQFPKEKSVAAKALLHVGMCQEKLGKNEAVKAYERVIRDFADQRDAVKEARARLSLLRQQTPSVAETGPSLRRVWTGTGVDLYGHPSPDGRYISCTDKETGCLVLIDVATGSKRTFPNPGMKGKSFYVVPSAWSPDSKRLAYEVEDYEPDDYHVELHIVGVDGSGDRVLYSKRDIWAMWNLDWSPDEKHIVAVFNMRDSLGSKKLFLLSTEDGSVRVLKTLDAWNGRLSNIVKFSPDGRFILYSSPMQKDSPECDIFLLSTDGTKETRLVQGPASERAVGWSADGEKVIYLSDISGSEDLWALRVVNGEAQGQPERIRANVGQIFPLGLTHHGSFFYSPKQTNTLNIFFASIDPQSGKQVAPQQLATRGFYGLNQPLGWSPDGKQLLYRSVLVGQTRTSIGLINAMISPAATALFTLSLNDKKEHEIKLPVRKDQMMAARWSSGENHILVRGTPQDGKEEWYVVNTESGESKPIGQTVNAKIDRPLSIAPDRKTLYFVRAGSIIAHDLEKGKERVLDSSLSSRIHPFVMLSPSWDGKHLAFYLYGGRGASCIFVVPTSSGESREVYRTDREIGLQRICWSRDGKYIYVGQSSKQPNKVELWRVPFAGGTAQPTGLSSTGLQALEFHPDGKTLVFASPDEQLPMEIWALDNLLQYQKSDFGARSTEPQNRQVWAGPDVDAEGAPSPDGRYLSYTDHKKNSLAIYDLKSGERTLIANPDANRKGMFVNESAWSPDGRQLAYSVNDEIQRAEIHLINLDGTGHRTLFVKVDTAETINYVYVEDWSRDGELILATFLYFYPVEGQIAKLAVVSTKDGSLRFIKTINNFDWQQHLKAFFSPDCRFIAYSAATVKGVKSFDAYIVAVDGSSEMNVTQHPADDRVLGWEPNGNGLLFASDRGGNYDLWATQIVNGKPQGFPELIRNNVGRISPLGLTNDGSLCYSVRGNVASYGWPPTESNIYLASLDPQSGKILSSPVPATMHNNGFNHSLPWSPDGKKLLYISRFGNTPERQRKMFMLSPETGTEQEIMHQFGSDSSLGWSNWFPDGKHLACWSGNMPNGANGIYELEIETGKMVPLVTSKDTNYYRPYVSPDGKMLFFESGRRIYSYDLQRKVRRLLFQSGAGAILGHVALSPDGGQLAFSLATFEPLQSAALMVMPSLGGEARAIFQMKDARPYPPPFRIDWSPDGKYIFFAKRAGQETLFELFRIPAQGGTPEPSGIVKEALHNISICPDGKRIAFSAGIAPPKPSIWVMENVFGKEEESKK